MSSRLGTHVPASVGGVSYKAFVRLDGLTRMLPDTSPFLDLYVRKEALLSSQIEGTQSSLADLLLFESEETPAVPLDYVAAMNHGLRRLREGFLLSLRRH